MYSMTISLLSVPFGWMLQFFFLEKNLGHQEYQYFQPNWLSWERGVKRTLELLKLASHHCGKNTFSSLSCYGKVMSTFTLFDVVWVMFRVKKKNLNINALTDWCFIMLKITPTFNSLKSSLVRLFWNLRGYFHNS